MARKGGILILLVLVVVLVYGWQQNPSKQAVNDTETRLQADDTQVIQADQKPDKKARTQPPTQPGQSTMADQVEALLLETTQPVFSDDVYIETQVFQAVFLGCDLFTSGFIHAEIIDNENGLAVVEHAKKHCAQLRQKRPRMYFISSQWNAADDIPSTSSWGKKIKALKALRGEERKPVEAALFKHALASHQAHWLVVAMMNINHVEHIFPYQQWLNSVDSRYVDKVVQLAVGLRICQQGDSHFCGPQGILMLEPCFNNPNMCGLDYNTWYLQAILPGMKKDVDLVLSHFRDFVDTEAVSD